MNLTSRGIDTGDDDASLEQWIEDASSSELAPLAQGIGRDIAAVLAAITQPGAPAPSKEERQMYGRSGYAVLRNRLLAAA
ncbi:transposase [Bradyrhizobium sp. Pear76]|uniref:hypothetical protein n=1 Tax=Bradyrhizobium oropedii TaxID=1571201 RepID=UPI001E56DFFC|nr:hypothetical protein [Bradyrhizobium oropedii]MCC8962443.1 transposase [Bradyrhizobium oropedii]